MLGAVARRSAFWGAVTMPPCWVSSLPLANAVVVDSHVVYALLLFGLGAFGAGRTAGGGGLPEDTAFVESRPWLRHLLG